MMKSASPRGRTPICHYDPTIYDRAVSAYRRRIREEPDIPFDDLVYLLAESVSDAQTKLDANTAEVLKTLAETEVDVVPRLTRTVGDDGSVTTDTAPTKPRSLLELGFTPSRYQFSEATVEIGVDISVAEHETRDVEREGRTVGLRAGTYEVTEQRRYDRNVEANARLTARLEPAPLPIDLGPVEDRTDTSEEDDAD